jgi:hypothetical protein
MFRPCLDIFRSQCWCRAQMSGEGFCGLCPQKPSPLEPHPHRTSPTQTAAANQPDIQSCFSHLCTNITLWPEDGQARPKHVVAIAAINRITRQLWFDGPYFLLLMYVALFGSSLLPKSATYTHQKNFDNIKMHGIYVKTTLFVGALNKKSFKKRPLSSPCVCMYVHPFEYCNSTTVQGIFIERCIWQFHWILSMHSNAG